VKQIFDPVFSEPATLYKNMLHAVNIHLLVASGTSSLPSAQEVIAKN